MRTIVAVGMIACVGITCWPGLAFADERQRAALPGIHGKDHRQPVTEANWPWRAIGRVNRAGKGFCTGVLVGERQVLTAAHCLWNAPLAAAFPAGSLHFVAGLSRGSYLAEARVARVTVSSVPAYSPTQSSYDVSRDWALLELDEPIGRTVGWIAPLTPAEAATELHDGTTLVMAGYNQDAAQSLRVDNRCGVERMTEGGLSFLHSCDGTKGASGAPLFVRIGGDYRVAGLLVGVQKNGHSSVAVSVKGMPTFGPAGREQ